MPVNPSISYSGRRVEPIYLSDMALALGVKFMPNISVKAGGLLGAVTSTSQSEIQTLNFSGTWAEADTFKISIVGIDGGTYSTEDLALDSTPDYPNADLDTVLEALLEAAGYHGATVAITNGPAPVDTTITFGGTAANKDLPLMTVSYVTAGNGTVTIDATQEGITKGMFGRYDDTASDGRQAAKAISPIDFRTDYWGRVVPSTQAEPSYGSVSGGSTPPQHGVYEESQAVWLLGIFKCSDLWRWDPTNSIWVQYPDANAVTDLGKVIIGSYNASDGIILIA